MLQKFVDNENGRHFYQKHKKHIIIYENTNTINVALKKAPFDQVVDMKEENDFFGKFGQATYF